jgi:hypothetical protein
MRQMFETLSKLSYPVVALAIGAALVALPFVTIDKDFHLSTHPAISYLPAVVGIIVILSAFLIGWLTINQQNKVAGGLDLTRVKEADGVLWTTVAGCEIRVVNGRIEDYAHVNEAVVVLPCNEYFDDHCANDARSALGAYANRAFDGQANAFVSLIKDECASKLGMGCEQQKTDAERGTSFGAGKCLLLNRPLGRSTPVALISTTTQRAGEGLSARISYLFDGMLALSTCLADARLNEIAMPVLGAGHGGIDPPLALVGLLLAVAEAARYGRGSQRLKKVTVVVFQKDKDSPAQVDQLVVRRALALIGSQG